MKTISRTSLMFALALSAPLGLYLIPDGGNDRNRSMPHRVGTDAARGEDVTQRVAVGFEPGLDFVHPPYSRRRSESGASRNGIVAEALKAANMPGDEARDRIMFASNRAGTFDLYSMNDDGTDLRLVVGGPRDELHPDISPDGSRLVFVRADDVTRPLPVSCCGPAVDLFIADSSGGGVRPLMPHPVIDDYRPDWSPDGTRIAFSRGAGAGLSNIYTIAPDGSDLTQVTEGVLGNNVASWSPDGTQLVFVSTRQGGIQIWVTDADGGNPHPITDPAPGVFDTSPQWSPKGERIVFGSDRDGGASELYTMRPDGSGLTRLTTNTESDSYATWSSDGKRIAWSRGSTSTGSIWVMNADGSDQRQISEGSFDTFPVYFPRLASQEPHGTTR